MQLSDVGFKIIKLSDNIIITVIKTIAQESPLSLQRVEFNFSFGGDGLNCKPDDFDTNDYLQSVVSQQSELIKQFICHFDHNLRMIVERNNNDSHDNVSFTLRPVSENVRLEVVKILSVARKNLRAIDSANTIQTVLGEELKRHYEKREAELFRLEEIAKKLIYQQEEFVQRKTEEFTNQRKHLEEEFKLQQDELKKEFTERSKKLEEREKALEKKFAEIDDRESKHVRRKLREDLKGELKNRSLKFELTKGTQQLRKPIFFFTIILLVFFGSGIIICSYFALNNAILGSNNSAAIITLALKQLAFAIAFASTAVFFIRWNNRWFERHANEEFKLKRHEIDLDRASWIVEMALEWQKEKGLEIPIELIEKLSQNLFSEDQAIENPLHPADQLASAILGASAGASVKFPSGAEIKLDRKSIKELKES